MKDQNHGYRLSTDPRNHFKFICPVLGIERVYRDELRLLDEHMKGNTSVGSQLVHCMMRAGKDPVLYMARREMNERKEIFYDADPECKAVRLPKSIVDQVTPVMIIKGQMRNLSEGEMRQVAQINEGVIPVGAALDHRDIVDKRRQSFTGATKPAEKPTTPVVAPTDYAAAITKAVAREVKASKPAATPQERPVLTPASVTAPTSPKPASAAPSAPLAASAPAPKLSLLEMAKRMKSQAA